MWDRLMKNTEHTIMLLPDPMCGLVTLCMLVSQDLQEPLSDTKGGCNKTKQQ